MKVKRKIISIDQELCDGCGLCVPSCAEGAIEIIDGKAKLVSENYCDGLGACLGECPRGALDIVEREAAEFDEEAVERHLSTQAQQAPLEAATLACGCPSSQIQHFTPLESLQGSGEAQTKHRPVSALSHWPVQIRLVPANAPFLKGADLLVAADCTPVAYPDFHRHFLKGKAVMVGCPKFDDAQAYIQKFADIFGQARIKSITVVVMEVPCCQGLPAIIEKAMTMSGEKIPMEKVTISAKGEILATEKLAA